MVSLHLSFVIPALNEANNIANTLSAIEQMVSKLSLTKEIILVDNGSTDGTPEVAKSMGAKVMIQPGVTIAGLRNLGAQQSQGNLLVFIDADVSLTREWSDNIMPVALALVAGERLLTGSHCSPPNSDNILLKHWFGSFATDPRNTHLGTGHMIVSKAGFEEIGGFDESLKTGEDYEFCERAKAHGFEICNRPELKVIHHDFPVTITSFIKREMWHGRGDLGSLSTMIGSKVVLGSVVFIVFHVALVLAVILGQIILTQIFAAGIIGLLISSSVIKNRHAGAVSVIYNAGIFYFYYLGRSMALLKRFLSGNS